MKTLALIMPMLASAALFTFPLPSCDTVFWLHYPSIAMAIACAIPLFWLCVSCCIENEDRGKVSNGLIYPTVIVATMLMASAFTALTTGQLHDVCMDRIQAQYQAAP